MPILSCLTKKISRGQVWKDAVSPPFWSGSFWAILGPFHERFKNKEWCFVIFKIQPLKLVQLNNMKLDTSVYGVQTHKKSEDD